MLVSIDRADDISAQSMTAKSQVDTQKLEADCEHCDLSTEVTSTPPTRWFPAGICRRPRPLVLPCLINLSRVSQCSQGGSSPRTLDKRSQPCFQFVVPREEDVSLTLQFDARSLILVAGILLQLIAYDPRQPVLLTTCWISKLMEASFFVWVT